MRRERSNNVDGDDVLQDLEAGPQCGRRCDGTIKPAVDSAVGFAVVVGYSRPVWQQHAQVI